jgi:zinc protease
MKTMLALVAVVALVGFLAQPSPVRPQSVGPPPLDIHVRTLPNGLKVYSVLDRTTSDVAVQVWYGVGAKDDPPGRSGFAHLFEHLMFKATRDMPAEHLTSLTDDVGGANNASTEDDATEFEAVVPSAHLPPLLWAEAERMSSLIVDQADFVAERAVVEDELRQNVLADPYGPLLAYDVPAASFTVLPYRRSAIGSIADLEAATLDDVRAFHTLYYRPDNASLIVVGAFNPDQLNAWVDRYFGPIGRPATPIPRVTQREPPRTGPMQFDSYNPAAPRPAVVLTFAGPRADSSDAVALEVLDAILSQGEASRLNARLVHTRQIAGQAFSDADLRQQGGLIDVGAILSTGVKISQGEEALRTELADLRDQPASDAELRRAKNQLLASLLTERESVAGVASEIGHAAVVQGDAARANDDVAALQAVTAADVQRVARTYLADDRRVTIRYHDTVRPSGASHAIPTATPVAARSPLGVDASATVAILPPPVPEPAPTAAASEPALPRPVERTLPNGLRVIVARTGDLPLATAYLAFGGGSALDPPGKAGLTQLTTSLAARGAGGRSAMEIESSIGALGDSLAEATDYDVSSFSLTGLAGSLPDGLAVLGDVARRPDFDARQLRRVRRDVATGLSGSLQDPGSITDFALAPLVFGRGPYGHVMSGLPKSLAQIDRADVLRQHQRLFRPDNAVLVLTGDVEARAAFALAERVFGDWTAPTGAPPAPAENTASPTGRAIAIDSPGAEEASVTVAARSIGRTDPAYYAVEVANAVIGGGYGARLNEAIRVKRGLTYDAGSEVDEFSRAGLFSATAQTRNGSAAEVAELMLGQLQALRNSPPAPQELAARKAELIGDYDRHIETSADLAAILASDAIYGFDVGEVARYPRAIAAVTADEVRAAAARLADPERTDLLVVGDAKTFLPAMRARFGDVEVIGADKINFASPDLR